MSRYSFFGTNYQSQPQDLRVDYLIEDFKYTDSLAK